MTMQDWDGISEALSTSFGLPPGGVTLGPRGGEQQPSALRPVRREAHDTGKVGLWVKLSSPGWSQPAGQGEGACRTL